MNIKEIKIQTNSLENFTKDNQKNVFKTIKRIVIENFSYCNRKCSFCTNSLIDRRSDNYFFSEDTFIKLIKELKKNNYQNSIAIGRYSEPLSKEITIERIKYIRKELPKCNILLNTNGDYLTPNLISQLSKAGLSQLKIMVYLPENTQFKTDIALKHSLQKLEKLNLEYKITKNIKDEIIFFRVKSMTNLEITMRCENYSKTNIGNDRGGAIKTLSHKKRNKPCFTPYYEINIDYNGNVMPCCNLVSDFSEHKNYILGNIKEESLIDIFYSQKAIKFRESIKEVKKLPTACSTCTYHFPKVDFL